MLKNSENNGTEEIGLVTPTPDLMMIIAFYYSNHYCGGHISEKCEQSLR